MTKTTTPKEELTLNQLVHKMQTAWTQFRDAQLYAFFYAAPVLTWARENEPEFIAYCKSKSIGCETHETRVVELMIAMDSDGKAISRERRAEYGNCVGWFADSELCPPTDPDKAVALARVKGRITGIAKEYRAKKDAENPKLREAKQEGLATKTRRAASAAVAREIVEIDAQEPDGSKPSIIPLRRAGDNPCCEASGDAEAMLEFLNRHGIEPGIQRELEESEEILIYLRVFKEKTDKLIWYGAAVDDDFADNIADIIVRQHKERSCKVAGAA